MHTKRKLVLGLSILGLACGGIPQIQASDDNDKDSGSGSNLLVAAVAGAFTLGATISLFWRWLSPPASKEEFNSLKKKHEEALTLEQEANEQNSKNIPILAGQIKELKKDCFKELDALTIAVNKLNAKLDESTKVNQNSILTLGGDYKNIVELQKSQGSVIKQTQENLESITGLPKQFEKLQNAYNEKAQLDFKIKCEALTNAFALLEQAIGKKSLEQGDWLQKASKLFEGANEGKLVLWVANKLFDKKQKFAVSMDAFFNSDAPEQNAGVLIGGNTWQQLHSKALYAECELENKSKYQIANILLTKMPPKQPDLDIVVEKKKLPQVPTKTVIQKVNDEKKKK